MKIEKNKTQTKTNIPNKKKKMNKDINLSILQELNAKILSDTKQKDPEIKEETEVNDRIAVIEQKTPKINDVPVKANSPVAPGWDSNYNPWAGVVEVKEEDMSDVEDVLESAEKSTNDKSKNYLESWKQSCVG